MWEADADEGEGEEDRARLERRALERRASPSARRRGSATTINVGDHRGRSVWVVDQRGTCACDEPRDCGRGRGSRQVRLRAPRLFRVTRTARRIVRIDPAAGRRASLVSPSRALSRPFSRCIRRRDAVRSLKSSRVPNATRVRAWVAPVALRPGSQSVRRATRRRPNARRTVTRAQPKNHLDGKAP